MESWLIRTSQNQIHRPCSRDEVKRLILEGRLKLQDEVCSGAGYWFYLHEAEELKRHLGIEMPRSRPQGSDEEITETSTQPDLDRTDPHLRVSPGAVSSADPEPSPESERTSESSTPLSEELRVEVRGVGIEPQPVLWTVAIVALIGGVGAILYWVSRLIQN